MITHIFIPCFIDQLYPQTGFNMVKVLEKAGCSVIYNPKQTCCGQPAFNAGFWDDARAVAGKFMKDFEEAEYIVVPSASCTGFVRNYVPKIFEDHAESAKALATKKKVYEFTEFLTDVLHQTDFGASLHTKATYHDSCAALRECHIKNGPRELLSHVKGLELVEMEDTETCCGFGGTFAVKYNEISTAMGEQKIQHADDTGAEVIISTDLSCLMHLDGCIKNKKMKMQVMHLADVLASGW